VKLQLKPEHLFSVFFSTTDPNQNWTWFKL